MSAALVALPFLVLLILLVCRVPVALALGAGGAAGIWATSGFSTTTATLASIPYSASNTFTLTLIPMFILLGLAFSHSGMLTGIFDVAQALTRRLPGALGVGTIAASAFMGGISGSSVADAATIGRMSIGEMSKRGYQRPLAAAIVASANTVAVLIPPSIVLVLYGVITQEPIGDLLLAGVFPGMLTVLIYCVYVIYLGLREPPGGHPSGAAGVPEAGGAPVFAISSVRTRAFGVVSGLLLFVIVVIGMYAGVFTATEAGAVGCIASLLLSAAYIASERGPAKGRAVAAGAMLSGAFREAAAMTGMIFALVVGASIFTTALILEGIPDGVANWIAGLDVAPWVVVALLIVMLLPLGMFVDGLSILLIVAPIAHPIVTSLGFSGVWFGIMMVAMIEIGQITPPVGLNVFVVAGLFPDLKVEAVFRRVLPFVACGLVAGVILFAFPEISLLLPNHSHR